MHGTTIKIINAQQAKLCTIYKNTRPKLLKTNAAIWFNKMCRIRHLRPNYINININGRKPQDERTTINSIRYRLNQEIKLLKTNAAIWFNKMCRIRHLRPNYTNININGRKPQDERTTINSIRYRLNQEIKFLCCKKQNFNQRLYNTHLKCAHHCNSMWQHIQNSINSQVNGLTDKMYQKLNKKLDILTKQTKTIHSTDRSTYTFHSRLINLTNVKFAKEQINTLFLGPSYVVEREPKQYINELLIDTENAIRHLDPKIQNPFRHLATKQIKHIMTTNTHNTLHRRYQHNLNQIRNILQQNNLTLAKVDKSKTTVIVDKNTLKQKVNNFIQENHITTLTKDPTDTNQKQIQQVSQKRNTLIDKYTNT